MKDLDVSWLYFLTGWYLSFSPLISSFHTLLFPLCHFLSLPTRQDEEKAASKKPGKVRPPLGCEKSADSSSNSSLSSAEKQRQEARKRLLAAKKAASFRQNSATESADSIEIYVPEAQTRLWKKLWERAVGLEQRTVKCQLNTWRKERKLLQCKWVISVKMGTGGGKRVGNSWVWRVLTHSYNNRLVLVTSNEQTSHWIFLGPNGLWSRRLLIWVLPLKTSADELYLFLLRFLISS